MKPKILSRSNHHFIHSSRILGLATLLWCAGSPSASQAAVQGNIGTATIEIDQPSANLYRNSNVPGIVDWVKDSLPNTDTPSLVDSIAIGLIPNVTAAPGGAGHWHGVRIVDGINGNDGNIFLTGGKENDLSTWNIGPGTVGSAKYDITQAYLANSTTKLFFGMERRGNNGTTAFDFEFNRLAPSPATPLFPNRSVGDVLFTFEMQGSGGSGSATAHFYLWDGSKYVEQTPAPSSLVSSINQVDISAAPWGFVNSKGNWALGSLPRFSFAEASVDLAQAFPGLDLCNGPRSFVQVRTRSSSTETSDLKDTTKIFEFLFGGPAASVSLDTDCLAQFTFNGSASKDSSGGSNLNSYSWTFTPPAGVTLSGAGITGPDANGAYHSTAVSGSVNVSLPSGTDSASITSRLTVTEGQTCSSTDEANIVVLRPVGAQVTLGINCNPQLTFDAAGSASGAGVTYKWDFVPPVGVSLSGSGITGPDANGAYHSTAASGTINVQFPNGVLSAAIFATLTVKRGDCTGSAQSSKTVLPGLTATITQKVSVGSSLSVQLTGNSATATSLQWQVFKGGSWQNIAGATSTTLDYGSFEADSSASVQSFDIDGTAFAGQLYQVQVRLHATRVSDSTQCEADSAAVLLKKVIAVDP